MNPYEDNSTATDLGLCVIEAELGVASAQERRPQPRTTGSTKPSGREPSHSKTTKPRRQQ
jgi:hypothetical protein